MSKIGTTLSLLRHFSQTYSKFDFPFLRVRKIPLCRYKNFLKLKMSAWRAAGLNYINYSNIASKMLRRALKPELRADALKRDSSHVRITPWLNGKPAHLQAGAAK